MNKKKVIKNIFIKGPITSDFIAKSIENHKTKKTIGAHELFLGQVRSDNIKGKEVVAIDFTAQEKMANKICHDIKESIFDNFPIYFSLMINVDNCSGVIRKNQIIFKG